MCVMLDQSTPILYNAEGLIKTEVMSTVAISFKDKLGTGENFPIFKDQTLANFTLKTPPTNGVNISMLYLYP